MERNKYNPQLISSIVSLKNEPLPKRYPDMYEVYKAFEETYGRNNFILTNGCENALRIVLLAIKAKKLLLEYPTWQLAELICDSLDIKNYRIHYHYSDREFVADLEQLKDYGFVDGLYTTDSYNNLFKHPNFSFASKDKWNIVDESYTADTLINNKDLEDNKIVIGSFSKFVDPGIRLGYIIFPEKLRSRFNALREEYICREAAEFVLSKEKIRYKDIDIKLKNQVCSHFTYITSDVKPDTMLPMKRFEVDGRSFYRIGYTEDLADYVY